MDALLPLLIAKAVVEVALGFLVARALLVAFLAIAAGGAANPIARFLALGTRPLEVLVLRLGGARLSPRSAPWVAAVLLIAAWVAVTALKIERCRAQPAIPACQPASSGEQR